MIVGEARLRPARGWAQGPTLARNRADRHLRSNTEHLALLAGLVWDAAGRRMSPTHTVKGPARYRYYSTKPDQADPRPLTRVAAADLEQLVVERLAGLLRDRSALHDGLEPFDTDAVLLEAVLFAARAPEQRLVSGSRTEARELLLKLVSRIDVLADEVSLHVRPATLLRLTDLAAPDAAPVPDLELVVPVRLFRRAREVRLAIAPGAAADAPAKDPAMIKLIAKAWIAREALMNGGGASLKEVAAANDVEPGYFAVLVKLGFLAPDIIAAILAGEQPQELTRQRLARHRSLPMHWAGQRMLLGIST